MRQKNKEELDMKIFRDVLNELIKKDKIKFSFYNNSLLKLDLLQICYNKSENILELDFRDVMGEHLKELREIMNNKKIWKQLT